MSSAAYDVFKIARDNQFAIQWALAALSKITKIVEANPDVLSTPLHDILDPSGNRLSTILATKSRRNAVMNLASLLDGNFNFCPVGLELVNSFANKVDKAKKRDCSGPHPHPDSSDLLKQIGPDKDAPHNHYENGDLYIGSFVDSKRHGKGTYSYKSGNEYTGDFLNDSPHGLGRYYYEDGNIYFGDYVHGSRHGHGIYFYANGGVFDGKWLNDKKQGEGAIMSGGFIHYGIWNKGALTYTYGKVPVSQSTKQVRKWMTVKKMVDSNRVRIPQRGAAEVPAELPNLSPTSDKATQVMESTCSKATQAVASTCSKATQAVESTCSKATQAVKSTCSKATQTVTSTSCTDDKKQCAKRQTRTDETPNNPRPQKKVKKFSDVQSVFHGMGDLVDECASKGIDCEVLNHLLPKQIVDENNLSYTIHL